MSEANRTHTRTDAQYARGDPVRVTLPPNHRAVPVTNAQSAARTKRAPMKDIVGGGDSRPNVELSCDGAHSAKAFAQTIGWASLRGERESVRMPNRL